MYKYVDRSLTHKLLDLAKKFPAISVTGPRQSGKTTLLQRVFTDKPYVSFEDPDVRLSAEDDPRGFLAGFPDGAIFDEAQRVPVIFSYLQGILDGNNQPGQFILSGSQNFLLKKNITQSLAGRIAMLKLLPFGVDEIKTDTSLYDRLFLGGYPRIISEGFAPNDWFTAYNETYLERDVKDLVHPKNLKSFQVFLKLCAARSGQVINYSALANAADVSVTTVKSWLGILEQSFITFALFPYHKNIKKRLIKSPKLYFHDTGFLCHLLGIRSPAQLQDHHLRGEIFENFVVAEVQKYFLHRYEPVDLFFYRDSNGEEVDLIIEKGLKTIPVEVKLNQTALPKFLKSIRSFQRLTGTSGEKKFVVYGGEMALPSFVPWRNLSSWLEKI